MSRSCAGVPGRGRHGVAGRGGGGDPGRHPTAARRGPGAGGLAGIGMPRRTPLVCLGQAGPAGRRPRPPLGLDSRVRTCTPASSVARPSSEPALDLAVALAAGLRARDIPLAPGPWLVARSSLLGGLRPVRVLNAGPGSGAAGIRQAIVPASEDAARAGTDHAGPAVALGTSRWNRCARRWLGRSGLVRSLRGSVFRGTVASLARCTASCDCSGEASASSSPSRRAAPAARIRRFDHTPAGYRCWPCWLAAGSSRLLGDALHHRPAGPPLIEGVSDVSAGEFVAAIIGLTIGLVWACSWVCPWPTSPTPTAGCCRWESRCWAWG